MIPAAARATAAGLCAILVGIGIARFAYTPLLPALIGAGWFQPSAAAYLGAANLMGYLAGAVAARRIARATSAVTVLRASMAISALSCFACAVPVSFAWYFAWRALAGFAGGGVVTLAAATVLPLVAPDRRGLASGAIFTGVGIGIVAGGTLVPFLLRDGPAAAWIGLGVAGSILTAWSWFAWPKSGSPTPPAPPPIRRPSPAMKPLYIAYALNAIGLVPHMVFLVDFVARGLGRGVEAGAGYWVLYGAGALCGPVLAGHAGDRFGFGPSLRWAFALQAALIASVAAVPTTPVLLFSSFVMGAFTPGVVPLVLGRTRELLPGDVPAQGAAWSIATVAFAIGQAAAAYGLSWLFAATGDHRLLFGLGAAALLAALAIDLAAGRRT